MEAFSRHLLQKLAPEIRARSRGHLSPGTVCMWVFIFLGKLERPQLRSP